MIDVKIFRKMMTAVEEAVGHLEDNDRTLSKAVVDQSRLTVAIVKGMNLLAAEIDKINRSEENLSSKLEELNSMMVDVGIWKEENV